MRPARAIPYIAALAALALAGIGQHVRYAELGYRAIRVEEARRDLLADLKRLETDRERLLDPRRLADLAAERGFVPPAPGQVRAL
jgi:hypothetical protein